MHQAFLQTVSISYITIWYVLSQYFNFLFLLLVLVFLSVYLYFIFYSKFFFACCNPCDYCCHAVKQMN